jgi:hypothetical protein
MTFPPGEHNAEGNAGGGAEVHHERMSGLSAFDRAPGRLI